MENQIEIYQGTDGQTQIEVKFEGDTFWLPLQQISELFQRDKSVISRHIRNIYKEGELDRMSTVAKNATVQMEGQRKVEREVEFYNLDLILSVGYRVNSKQGTQFRIWATKRLKDYLIQGYAINENRLAQKQQEVQTLKDGIRILSRAIQQKEEDRNLDFEWLNHFAKGLELLDDYDHENLDKKGLSKRKATYPELSEYQEVIKSMRSDFESGVFGKEKDGSFESAIAQISKGFGEKDFYPTLEEKAATLLYLIVKNHGFVDGNKRIAAACFLLFLKSNDLLKNSEGISIISNDALASLTLFIASSKPEEMETVKKLVISVLNRNRDERH
ncbi:RhuM family protein [Algoriphagus vanfongensis]|uniref:RhuM family protein n=1 Tax=Algoriphagus vanfongensis TaxID=426371 RepID=UPI00047A7596|nr:RhuM family protein [Algoriphagus vanfongensis]